MEAVLSSHFKNRAPSAIRLAQMEFAKRSDDTAAINTAIGNVSLPMYPAMIRRMSNLGGSDSPFMDGIVRYSATVGNDECRDAFLNVIRASKCNTDGLFAQITDGGSAAMELVILGVCGPAGTDERPLLVIDAAYTNYKSMADRVGRKIVSICRHFKEDTHKFSLPDIEQIKSTIDKYNPGALVVIPYDNPTGHFYDHKTMIQLGKICVEKGMWMISDEAYRELYYLDSPTSSIWALNEDEVPGIRGCRISIETASKVWNACGLRIGAIVTDNKEFFEQSVAENTANLCPNVIGQYIFGALAHESIEDLDKWFKELRGYYKDIMVKLTTELKERLPGIMVSSPDASIYSVIDVKNIAPADFNAQDFVLYCAQKGSVDINGKQMTLLVSPMSGFYNVCAGEKNPGQTQMRVAYVLPPEDMAIVPELFEKLFISYASYLS